NSAPYDTYNLNTPIAGLPSPNYKVCWAHAPGIVGGKELYRVPLGLLTVNGPNQVSQECTLGLDCVITLSGTGLVATNQVFIIDDGSSCGDASPTLAAFSGVTNPQQTEVASPGTFSMGIPRTTSAGPGVNYKVCWAHNPSSSADFKVLLGTFKMNGPEREGEDITCTMGLSCSFLLTGVNLVSTNRIMVTKLTDTCGQAVLNVVSFTGVTNPLLATGPGANGFDLGVPTFGMPG
ncbi:unnamed protein product, partial [Polarella glacialis]